MKTIKLSDEIYTELHILTRKEWDRIGSDWKTNVNGIKGSFLPGYGTTLFFENKHFLIIDEKRPLVKCAIWRNHKIIGHCELTENARQKANGADNAVFYFGIDRI